MTRGDALRKCIIVFDALKRVASKGNAGLEPAKGAEEEFRMDTEVAQILREMLREMQGEKKAEDPIDNLIEINTEYEKKLKKWQEDVIENGAPERLFIL